MASPNDIGFIITLILFCGIYTPISCYQIWHLYSCTYHKTNALESLRKRNTPLSLIASLAYTIQFIDLSIWSLAYSSFIGNNNLEIRRQIIFSSSLIHLIMQFTLSFVIVLRFWLLYYKIIYQMISTNNHWKKIINPDYQILERISSRSHTTIIINQANSEWIINNNLKWGKLRYCLKMLIVPFVLLLICIIITQSIHQFLNQKRSLLGPLSSLITYLIFALCWSCLLWIYCRTPSFYDHIFVKKELSYLFHIMIIFFFIYVIYAVLFGFGDINQIESDKYFQDILIYIFHLIALFNFIIIHIFTYIPLKKLREFDENGKHNNNNNVNIKRNDTNHISIAAQKLKIEDCLKNEYGFDAMMKHLHLEFSTEILLSITEFTQFKKYLIDNVTNMAGFAQRNQVMFLDNDDKKEFNLISPQSKRSHKESDVDDDAPYIVLPFDKIPQSAIVYNDELSNIEKAYLLYDKYIRSGCEYEINIAGALRNTYKLKMQNKRKWMSQIGRKMDVGTLSEIFDKSIDIMMGLMGHSFVRFKKTSSWKKVVVSICSKASIDYPVD